MPQVALAADTPIAAVPFVGEVYAQRMRKLEITTVADMLRHYPSRYLDFSLISTISQLQPGETATIQGQIVSVKNIFTRTHKQLQKAIIADRTGQTEVLWFNQPYLIKAMPPGTRVALAGVVETFLGKPSFTAPEYEILRTNSSLHTGRLVPIYPETAGVSSKWLRSRIAFLLKSLESLATEWLPDPIRKNYRLIDLATSLRQIHFPTDEKQAMLARQRLAFDELLEMQLAGLLRRRQWQKKQVRSVFTLPRKKIAAFIANLPFQLTADQIAANADILKDLERVQPMNRLLQGDVGAGKTVVAALACYVAFLNHQKTAFMVPTAILADQHLKTLESLLKPHGMKIGFYTGTQKSKLPAETVDLFLGTHALLFKDLDYQNLGLVVIDEQHRFGVEQRAQLLKQSPAPHLLTMTATPIPRTVALGLYGDLDISYIENLPSGRLPVKTWVVPKLKRQAAYSWIEEQIAKHQAQVFVVCPIIEESESERLAQVKAATVEFTQLKQIFPKRRLGLLHGRLKTAEKQAVMAQMSQGKLDILVTTPVVEVGIDIPEASIILIEAAERFGLAQLHQLRGRVGRRGKQSYCLLFSELENAQNLRRLKAMESYHSGAKLAQIDLRFRGPGEIYGVSQAGFMRFKLASFGDTQLLNQTKEAAREILDKYARLPALQKRLKKITILDVKPN